MKNFLSVVLAITILLTATAPSFATTVAQPDMRIATAIASIKKDLPDAEITVVGDTIHIVVDDFTKVKRFINSPASYSANAAKTTRATSIEGGSFRNFDIPWYGYLSFIPASEVYMNKDLVDSILLDLNKPDIVKWIVEQSITSTVSDIVVKLFARYGISLSVKAVNYICSFLYYIAIHLEYWSLQSAQEKSPEGKVSVVYGTLPEGVYTYIYTPWSGDVCVTSCGYPAMWYECEYDI